MSSRRSRREQEKQFDPFSLSPSPPIWFGHLISSFHFYSNSTSLDFLGMKFNISFNTDRFFCEWDTVADLSVDFEGVSSGTVFGYL